VVSDKRIPDSVVRLSGKKIKVILFLSGILHTQGRILWQREVTDSDFTSHI
jgi:hypothetical protein